jgi:acetolactate synthase-1/2/3 large subunit
MNGAQWFVRTLRERGVEYVFVLCGNGLNAFLDACLDFDMKVIDTRNEQAASYMADTWGRFTRRIGVVAVSSGPGHTNAVTGLANAFWDGGPMLLVSGCSSQQTRGMDNFQEINQVGMVAPISKYASMVHHIETLENETNKALSAAVTGRPGPVHLTIPADVLSARVDESRLLRDKYPIAEVVQRSPGDSDLVREAVELLASAKRPFVIIGSGTFYAQAGDALRKFAQLTNIPIMSHIWDRACVDTVIPQYFGITNDELSGAYSEISEADVILILGARVDYRLGYGRPPVCSRNVRWIRVDYEPSEINRTIIPDIGIVGDTRSVLLQMTEEVRRIGKWENDEWLSEVRQSHAKLLSRWENVGHENVCPVPAMRICREIKKFLDRDVTFLLDGGNIGRWAHMLLFDRHPAHWFTCGASGIIGWGLPGAIAIKLAKPDKPVLLLSGDGSAGFTVTEIETALRFNTPYVAVVAHDSAWGIVADGQRDDRRVASEFGVIRFDKVAEALGARGVFIENPNDLYPAIERGLNEDTVTFIHVPTQLAGVSAWEKRFGKKK